MQSSMFQYTNPAMTKAVFKVNSKFKKMDSGVAMPAQLSVHKRTNDGEPMAYVEVEVKVGEESDELPFLAIVSYGANFKWDPKAFSGEQLNRLLSKNAPALLLGYARTAISTITNFSAYPAYNLPFVDLRGESTGNEID